MSPDVGLLILRLVVGTLFVGHGAQKLFGWFGGYGVGGTAGWLGSIGLRPARFWALIAGVFEFGGGLLLALGLLYPLGSLGIIAAMLAAIALVHWPRIWVTDNGLEYPLVNLAAATALALAGPGYFALDRQFGTALPMPETFLGGLLVAVLGLVGVMLISSGVRPVPALSEQEALGDSDDERRAA